MHKKKKKKIFSRQDRALPSAIVYLTIFLFTSIVYNRADCVLWVFKHSTFSKLNNCQSFYDRVVFFFFVTIPKIYKNIIIEQHSKPLNYRKHCSVVAFKLFTITHDSVASTSVTATAFERLFRLFCLGIVHESFYLGFILFSIRSPQ